MRESTLNKKRRYLADNQGIKPRRQDRAQRKDVMRLWRDGMLDEEETDLERWSREAKKTEAKVSKKPIIEQCKEGLVLEVNRRTCIVSPKKGDLVCCHFSSNLDLNDSDGIAVGDNIRYSRETGPMGTIETILPRSNVFYRPGPSERQHKRLVMAANIDRLVIVMARTKPDFSSMMLDRYLIRAQILKIPTLICLNKVDLENTIPPELHHLKTLGYDCVFCSAKTMEGIPTLLNRINGQKLAIIGPSGVGKSSIINRLNPQDVAAIGEVRKHGGQGRHTTTRSSLYFISKDTWLIDTPGLRDVSIIDLNKQELAQFFPDFQKYSGLCKFRNCQHLAEQGCAVTEAVANKKIKNFRYKAYRNLYLELQAQDISKY